MIGIENKIQNTSYPIVRVGRLKKGGFIMYTEKEMVSEIEEFFNEEDHSVGLYAVGRIDKNVVDEFLEVFGELGLKVIYYQHDELEFKIEGNVYIVAMSTSYECWKVFKVVK